MKDNKITVKELKRQLAMLEEKGYGDYVVWAGPVEIDDSWELSQGLYDYNDREKAINHYFNTSSQYEEKYLPDCWKTITEEEIQSGHGGMDVLMMKAFFNAVKAGAPMPIDVYDAASWMAISCLSEISVQGGGRPVDIPDFTRGNWLLRQPEDII